MSFETECERRRVMIAKRLVDHWSLSDIARFLDMSAASFNFWRRQYAPEFVDMPTNASCRAKIAREWLERKYPTASQCAQGKVGGRLGKTCRRYVASKRAECGKPAKRQYCSDCFVDLNYSHLPKHEGKAIAKMMGAA